MNNPNHKFNAVPYSKLNLNLELHETRNDELIWINPDDCVLEWSERCFKFETDDYFITGIDRNSMICAAQNDSVSTAKKYDVCFGDDGGKTEYIQNMFKV